MISQEWTDLIALTNTDALEAAWNKALEQNVPSAELSGVLDALTAAGKTDLAEVLAWALLNDRSAKAEREEALSAAHVAVSTVPASGEIRAQAEKLFRTHYADHPHLDLILHASGLSGEQSARRAFRTLDKCLNLHEGAYLYNRFEELVLEMRGFDTLMTQFELVDSRGRMTMLDPKAIADDYDLVDESDFRVLRNFHPDRLGKLLEEDPAGVLIGICISHKGRIDAFELKGELVPKYLEAEKWSAWWSRARTAAKKCPQLALEGRSPVALVYHAQGLSLEEELAPTAKVALMPLEKLAVLENYARQAKQRKVAVNVAWAGTIVNALAEQAISFVTDRPADALAATLALDALAKQGLPKPAKEYPAAAAVLAKAAKPALAIAQLENDRLWPAALEALTLRPDHVAQLESLLYLTPTSLLDDVAQCLARAGDTQAASRAASEALANPIGNMDLFLWLWKGPAAPLPNQPGKVELLNRILGVVAELDHDWQLKPADVKAHKQRIRAALSATNYASYRQALAEMSEAVAGTFKDRINRSIGLAEAVHDDMMNMLRESHYGLFVKATIEPWLDEVAIWTTEAALDKRQALLKEVVDIKMLENARAIGAAAEHGDLRENGEWKSAMEERDILRARAAKLQEEIACARVIRPEDIPTDSVGIGSKVMLRRVTDGRELAMSFLGPWDSDIDRGLYSYQTGVGQDLMGKHVGDTIHIRFEGMEGEYRIDSLGAAL